MKVFRDVAIVEVFDEEFDIVDACGFGCCCLGRGVWREYDDGYECE